jgi:hypothetical protein
LPQTIRLRATTTERAELLGKLGLQARMDWIDGLRGLKEYPRGCVVTHPAPHAPEFDQRCNVAWIRFKDLAE